MKKLLFVLLLGVVWAGTSEAAGPTRGAKGSYMLSYATTVSSPTATAGPFVVYGVVVSTGASGDYVALFDSSTVTGLTFNSTTAGVFKGRCYASTTTAATFCNYDPPLQFNLGLQAALSTANDHALIIFERGRVTQGY